MRKLFAVLGVILLPFAVPTSAGADTLVTFESTSSGTRILTAATAPTFPLLVDLNQSQTIATSQIGGTPAATTVTETLASGNTWSVKAQMCGPNNYAVPTAGDCTNKPARMERADGDAIAGTTIAVSHGAPVTVLGGGTTVAGAESNLGGQITLLSNTGQSALALYTGTYTGTTNLSISNLTRTGVWKGMWVVTHTL